VLTRGQDFVQKLLADILNGDSDYDGSWEPFPLDPCSIMAVPDIIAHHTPWAFLRVKIGDYQVSSTEPIEPIKVFLGVCGSSPDDERPLIDKLISVEPRQLLDMSPTPLSWLLLQDTYDINYTGDRHSDLVPWIAAKNPAALGIVYKGMLPIHIIFAEFCLRNKRCYPEWVKCFASLNPRGLLEGCDEGLTPLNIAIIVLGFFEYPALGEDPIDDMVHVLNLRNTVTFLLEETCKNVQSLNDLILQVSPSNLGFLHKLETPWCLDPHPQNDTPRHTFYDSMCTQRNYALFSGTLRLSWYLQHEL